MSLLSKIQRKHPLLNSMVTLAVAVAFAGLSSQTLAQHWPGSIEVIRGNNAGETISGFVFEDLNADSQRQNNESGVAGVLVSNGLDVVRTDGNGRGG
jgi:hypothetical protein